MANLHYCDLQDINWADTVPQVILQRANDGSLRLCICDEDGNSMQLDARELHSKIEEHLRKLEPKFKMLLRFYAPGFVDAELPDNVRVRSFQEALAHDWFKRFKGNVQYLDTQVFPSGSQFSTKLLGDFYEEGRAYCELTIGCVRTNGEKHVVGFLLFPYA